MRAPRRRPTDPRTWPVRWRLAAASAGLSLAILLVFAGVIGYLATERIRDDFNREMRTAVTSLSQEVEVTETPAGILTQSPQLDDFARPNDAVVRILGAGGQVLQQTPDAQNLGPVQPGISRVGPLRVITEPIISDQGNVAAYVQYARSEEHVDSTTERLWLFIAVGVIGAVILASLAGFAIASRAMQPIASLTAMAGEIASTRDPSRHMPQPRVDDEIGELARTLEQMLRSLDAARAESEDTMRRQREFVADASHELRTPLTSVIANLELLQTSLDGEDDAEERTTVDSALRSSRRMSRLVGDLLLLARADAGRIGERDDCDLAEIATNAARELAPLAGERRLQVADGQQLPVYGNADELHRMVANLLENALRHTPDGSTVQMRLHADDGSAFVEVTDDGPGIPEQMREQIFDRFVRGNGPADTSGGTGAGLGLAIVRAVATSHGGEVKAGDSPLGGASLTVRLPLNE